MPSEYFDDPDSYVIADLDVTFEKLDPATAFVQAALAGASWFDVPPSNPTCSIPQSASTATNLPTPIGCYSDHLKVWEHEIKIKLNDAAAARRSQLDPTQDCVMQDAPATMHGYLCSHSKSTAHPQSWQFNNTPQNMQSFEDDVREIANLKGLNTAQCRAFEICANKFREVLECGNGKDGMFQPLRLFLTGPGGTGKMYVVNCLKLLME